MKITTIGIDLAKVIFQAHGVDEHGKVRLRKPLKRKDVVSFFANLEPCLIGMEACGSAHYWARKISELGHTVRLMAPQFVKPYGIVEVAALAASAGPRPPAATRTAT